jgi:putative ABC transport system permease protein
MTFAEAFRAAIWTLLANPLRSFLTLLGIIIGIAAIIAVIAVINGLNLYVAENLSDLGSGVFVISKFGIITNHDDFLEAIRRNRDLDLDDMEAIRERVPLAEVVAAEARATTPVRYRDQTVQDVAVGGITPDILEIEPYDVAAGRILGRVEVERAAAVVFLGSEVAEKLFGTLDPIGKKVKIRGRSMEVVGVAKKRGSVFGFSRDVYAKMPISTFHKIFGSRGSVNISVKSASLEMMDAAADQCRVVLRARHHLDYDDEDDFGIVNAEGINAVWKDLTRILFTVAIFVVGLSLVVGGIVIMNIMLVSVLERTREIGIRKAVGARQRDIRLQFLIESVILSCVGGAVGVSAAFAISWTLRTLSPLPAAFPAWAPVLAFVICSAIGIFFGLQPAAAAARLDPIEALRSEG